ncbi:MAG: hypothetical protein HKN23_18700 [Verrucomicrobiales bacterium]|nr:hypothetical protein [Verrucomicrobiales bacterium]
MSGGKAINQVLFPGGFGDDLSRLDIQHNRLGALRSAVDSDEKGHGQPLPEMKFGFNGKTIQQGLFAKPTLLVRRIRQ